MKPNNMNSRFRPRNGIVQRCKRAAALLCLYAFAAQPHAAPITYTFSGIGSGQVFGGAFFNNAPFTISLSADTDNVVPLLFPTHPELTAVIVDCSSSTFSITGLGTGMFTVPTVVFDNLSLGALGFSVAVPAGLPSDVLDIKAPDFFSYGLTTSIGPVGPVDSSYLSFIMPTTLGNLALSSASTISFDAVIVPEPSTILMVVGGAFLLLPRRICRTPKR